MSNIFQRTIHYSLIGLCINVGNAFAGDIVAELDWHKRLVLSTTETGVVDKVFVAIGQSVKKGDVLLNLDAREFKAAHDQASALLLAAKTTHAEAKRELIRTQELFDRTMISEHDLQVVKNSEAQAKAQLLGAKASLQQAEIALERSRVQAPYDCIVLNIMVQSGQTIISTTKSEPLAIIAASGLMTARVYSSKTEIDKFASLKAQQVSVMGRTYPVISQALMREANEKGQYALVVVFESNEQKLFAGQAAKIVIQ